MSWTGTLSGNSSRKMLVSLQYSFQSDKHRDTVTNLPAQFVSLSLHFSQDCFNGNKIRIVFLKKMGHKGKKSWIRTSTSDGCFPKTKDSPSSGPELWLIQNQAVQASGERMPVAPFVWAAALAHVCEALLLWAQMELCACTHLPLTWNHLLSLPTGLQSRKGWGPLS